MPGGLIVKIARQAADQYIRYQQISPLALSLPEALLQQHACYVSIYEKPGRHFRAMFGSPLPRQPHLAAEVVHNTVEAIRRSNDVGRAFRQADLEYLVFSITVLGSLERITEKEHLNPHSLGLYVRSDRNKAAVILPQRTGIETPEEQIATAFRESNIDPRQEAVTMYRFPVISYE